LNIITFNLSNQRLRRFTSGLVYANSYGKTIFHFNFNTPDWNISPTKTAVFSYRGHNYSEPLDENNMCKVPKEVLHEGYFTVSVQDGRGLLTNSIRVPVSPMPEELVPDAPGGNCDCGPSMVYVPTIDDKKILSWVVQEATEDMPVPNPVDLNIADDWVDDETESDYIWEEE
jgi:hypothetical protein